jgi:hypothetical protein
MPREAITEEWDYYLNQIERGLRESLENIVSEFLVLLGMGEFEKKFQTELDYMDSKKDSERPRPRRRIEVDGQDE